MKILLSILLFISTSSYTFAFPKEDSTKVRVDSLALLNNQLNQYQIILRTKISSKDLLEKEIIELSGNIGYLQRQIEELRKRKK